ncbi:sister chromatid cohesion protein Eso1 [Didymella exigua CBS 183.55]|uniref:DNA polymerase eta n=1 Tax=Didymella exigua CBS 183.55 TaxID=1150837 RepID=A0A6A5REM3_9PLEO|nr:sister chromatid cohesion protein Eso1 [Didymella exigua CBS 183.55]KAF1925750.1 sister chromatid cohesion protein Eso1 [Didymella exigua CBS 183.55]
MSSPAPFFVSSSLSITSPRQIPKSKFTYKQLHQLESYSTQTPLRVIAHVDLDAFYAQCETVRLGIDPAKPLAVQQWQGLIAINYPARAFGLSRHVTSTEALKQCPELIMQHVATWKEGDEKWAYHEDSFANMATHKVSLDPYRLESRRILKCIKEALPEKEQRVEKASIDEVFMDLSAQVHNILLERYPMLRGPPPYDDSTEPLPKVPTTVLDWAADALVETGEEDGEDKDPDWDDVCMVIASEIVRDVRKRIEDTLHYTCSGGVARNKMLAKLGSGYKKPNQQTVIRNRAVKHFLSNMKFTNIRNLGGKLGDEVVAMFGTDKVKDLMEQPLVQLKKLGDDTGSWLYSIIRGEDNSEVNTRTQIKSMLSAKSFRPSINSFEQGVRWIRIFVADIFSRCVEEGVLENRRRPKTIVLHHRQGAQTRSRSAQIPQGKALSEAIFFDLAKNLLAQVVVDGRAWPCANLSLSVGGFEDGPKNNAGIGGFLVRGEQAKAIMSSDRGGEPPAKKRRTKGNIAKFFGPRDEKRKDFDAARAVLMKEHSESTRDEAEDDVDDQDEEDASDNIRSDEVTRPITPTLNRHGTEEDIHIATTPPSAQPRPPPDSPPLHHNSRIEVPPIPPALLPYSNTDVQKTLNMYFCPKCNLHLPKAEEAEHIDYHFALDLSKEMRHEERIPPPVPKERAAPKPSRGRGRPPGSGTGRCARGGEAASSEKGQKKLFFG